jgi:hypothetical protein
VEPGVFVPWAEPLHDQDEYNASSQDEPSPEDPYERQEFARDVDSDSDAISDAVFSLPSHEG